MKTWKFFSGICLAVLLTMGLTPAAWAALITSDSQAVLLTGNSGSDTSGILSFAKLNRIKPDGTSEPFVLPSDKSIVITWMQFNVTAVNTTLVTQADLRMGPFYSRALNMNNGAAGFTETIDPGISINPTGFTSPTVSNFYTVNLKNDVTIPGTINVRLVGFLVSYP